jgi:hypothetical protein
MCGIASIFMRRLWRIGDKGDEGFFHSLTLPVMLKDNSATLKRQNK